MEVITEKPIKLLRNFRKASKSSEDKNKKDC